MVDQLRWDDAEELGVLLSDMFPDQNPLQVRFTDMHRMITQIPQFIDDRSKSNEGKLEAIQMAWYEEYQDRRR